jgi:CelD/BcsL family acetyltransferase involved in cellulose biosynthesis
MSGSLSVRVLTDVDEIWRAHDRLSRLRDDSDCRNPFAGPEWTLNWLSAFAGPRKRPWLVEVYRADTLVGALPMWEQRSAVGKSVLRPAGRGKPWVGPFEIPGALALPEEGRQVGRAAVAHLCELADGWNWAHIALGDIAPWLEPEWLPTDDFLLLTRQVTTTVILDLSPGGDPFRPKRNLREAIRRAKNRLDRDVDPAGWGTTRAVDPSEVSDALKRLIHLHRQRSLRTDKAAIHPDVLADGAVRSFVETAITDMAQRGLVSIYELVVRGEVIAAQLVLHTKNSTHFSLSGQLDSAWHYSSITYLQWIAVLDAQAAGHDLVDFSAGPIQSKLRWSDQTRSYHEFAVVAPRRASRLAYWAELPRTVAARMLEAERANRRSPRGRDPGA